MLNKQINSNLTKSIKIKNLHSFIKNHTFHYCKQLIDNSSNIVIDNNNPNSNIMIIGEAPGKDEDLQGIPFCGRSGKLLNNILQTLNIHRNNINTNNTINTNNDIQNPYYSVYITNTVFWRPENNRKPTDLEKNECLPFIEIMIHIIKPQCIFLLGKSAISLFFPNLSNTPIKDAIKQKNLQYSPKYTTNNQCFASFYIMNDIDHTTKYTIKTFCMYHPSYLLRSRSQITEFIENMRYGLNTTYQPE